MNQQKLKLFVEKLLAVDAKSLNEQQLAEHMNMVAQATAIMQGVPAGLNEFAPGSGGGESGRWYTDDQMTDLVGDGWYEDMDVSGNIPKQQMIQQAQAWLDDQGYNVQVLNCKLNDDDMDWFIQGSFHNPNFAKKGVAEGAMLPSPKPQWSVEQHAKRLQSQKEKAKAQFLKKKERQQAGELKKQGVAEGMLDNPGEQDSPVASAITRRILLQRTDLLAKYGPVAVGQAIDEVADFVGDVDEIGSSDVSGWIRHVEQMLGNMENPHVAEAYVRVKKIFDTTGFKG